MNKIIRIKIFILLLCSFHFTILSQGLYLIGGTTTITLLTRDTIWMAADSKNVIADSTKHYTHNKFANKILNYNNVFFTLAGRITEILNYKKIAVFNANNIVKENILKYKNFDSIFDNAHKSMAFELNQMYATMPLGLKNDLQKNMNTKLIEMIMVNNENGKLTVKAAYIGFTFNNNSYSFFSLELTTPVSLPSLIFTGFSNEIKPLINKPEYFKNRDIGETLIKLIQIEEKAFPDYVGGTIDVIAIYKGGHKWLTNNHY